MTDYEKEVMRNIIYAVETGGQVYGNKDYADFTEAYANTSNEKAITIGAGQWYATEAQRLLKNIRQKNPSLFAELDTAGIGNDLDTKNWATYQVSKDSAKAKCIIRIIDSEVGHQCQDLLVDEQMEAYVQEAANLGVTDMDAKMMCANFRHQGGLGAVTRILAKTETPYTLDHLYAACKTDTGNQVGAYKSRQKMVYESLKKYISNFVVTPEAAIQAAIKVAQDEVGYLEKKSNYDLDSKTGNAGDGNYTKYWRDIRPEWQKSPWCACFVTWVFVQAFGKAKADELLKHYPYVYVPDLASRFTHHANPAVGDVVMFWNGKTFSHTGLVIDVQGDLFVTIEGNTGPNTGIIDNGDGVYQKKYYNSKMAGTKFARPDYSVITDINSGGSGENPFPGDSWKPTGTAICTGEGVNVRATPGGTVIGSVNKGTRFEVDGTKSGEWVHVKVSGIGVGYMHQDYVSYDNTSGGSWTTTGTATCTGNGVYVRATPGGSIIGSLNKGNRFEVDGKKSGEWVHIKVPGIGIGYMHQNYVSYDNGNHSNVSIAQAELNKRFNAGLAVDGVWGANSKKAYISAIQSALNSVYGAGLSVDGIWGKNTEKACAAHVLKEGANNLYVGVLQIGLYSTGMSLSNGIDCDFGPSTKQGVIKFQNSKGLSADGMAGADTFRALTDSHYAGSGSWTTTGTGTCTGDGVYVRLTPGGNVIGSLYRGDTFEVDGTRIGSWVHVRVKNIGIGYMHQNYVSLGGSAGGSTVKTAQAALNSLFGAGISVDGSWGANSKRALIKAIQSALNKVYGTNLVTDGLWGAATEAACASHVLSQGANNLYVGAIQIGLYAHGISLSNGIDRDFGPSTKQGVISFQSRNGLSADGMVGKDTVKALIR